MSHFEFKPRLSPAGYAREVLHELRVTSFPVNVKELIRERGISYRESDFRGVQAFDGCLIRREGKALIIVNSSIPYAERRNFTAAHELGHYEIKGHDQQEYRCSGRDIEAFKAQKIQEYEANQFAAELLMPESLIRNRLGRSPFNLDTIKELSYDFGTSLTSAALRAVELSPDRCAVVVSGDGRILWSKKSESFRYELRSGLLSDDTYAADFFKGLCVPEGPQRLGPRGWLSGRGIPDDLDLIEHSVCFSNLGLVLTLLYFPDTEEEEEEETWDY